MRIYQCHYENWIFIAPALRTATTASSPTRQAYRQPYYTSCTKPIAQFLWFKPFFQQPKHRKSFCMDYTPQLNNPNRSFTFISFCFLLDFIFYNAERILHNWSQIQCIRYVRGVVITEKDDIIRLGGWLKHR